MGNTLPLKRGPQPKDTKSGKPNLNSKSLKDTTSQQKNVIENKSSTILNRSGFSFKKILIQKLQERSQFKGRDLQAFDFVKVFDRHGRVNSLSDIYMYEDTGVSKKRIVEQTQFEISHFFTAFSAAYTQHGDIVLIPDEIWIMICFFVSKYVNDNAEKLRPKLVKHEGVKKLTIYEGTNSEEESIEAEKNWTVFFEKIIEAIQKQTKGQVVKTFSCDFSTTNLKYKTISTALVMNSMQKFFKYSRFVGCACGINNVYMAGNREDWVKMIDKLNLMVQFDLDGKIKEYIKHVKIILQNFVNTYDQKPDVGWWNTIMTTPEKRRGYLSENLVVQGWILHFFGIYEREAIEKFPQMNIEVPITLFNEWTKTEKQMMLLSDWVSVSKLDDRTYKPDVGVAIVKQGQRKLLKFMKEYPQIFKNIKQEEEDYDF